MNRVLLFLFIYTACLTVTFTQNKYSGTVVDSDSNNPIDGVIIVVNNDIIAVTNQKGKFTFNLQLPADKTEVSFIHLSYTNKLILANDLSNNIYIKLSTKPTVLDEVVIGENKKLTKKQIIKSAVNSYTKSLVERPYWAGANLKQIVSYKDITKGYMETDANLLVWGSQVNSPWYSPILVPLKVRRTVEDEKLSILKSKMEKEDPSISTLFGSFTMGESFLMYRCFEKLNPLQKKRYRNFDFNIEKTVDFNNELCYLISFKERKSINIGLGHNITLVRGQLWISKENFQLRKITSSFSIPNFFNFGRYNIFAVNYNYKEDVIYPNTIYYKGGYHNDINLASDIDKTELPYPFGTSFKMYLTFTDLHKSSPVDFEKYRPKGLIRSSIGDYFINSPAFEKYDSEYWRDRSIQGTIFENEVNDLIGKTNVNKSNPFNLGALQKVNKNIEDEVERYKQYKEIISLMESELNN